MTKCSTPLGGSTPVGEEKGAESEEGKAGLRCGLDKASPDSWRALNLGWPFKVIPGGSGVRAFIYPPSPIYIHRSTAHWTDAGFPWEVGVTLGKGALFSFSLLREADCEDCQPAASRRLGGTGPSVLRGSLGDASQHPSCVHFPSPGHSVPVCVQQKYVHTWTEGHVRKCSQRHYW